jgi:alpha-ketoglutarate-dependent taurine dioxygenase
MNAPSGKVYVDPNEAFAWRPDREPLPGGVPEFLRWRGWAWIQLPSSDSRSDALVRLGARLGTLLDHKGPGTHLWEIRSIEAGERARSHGMEAFPLHTDGSFENPSPPYIGMHVVGEDRNGGGESLFLDGKELLNRLSAECIGALANEPALVRVPPEFRTGVESIRIHILRGKEFAFRSDIVVREECSPDQSRAIDELQGWLDSRELTQRISLPGGTVILLDNRRFFHGRTEVRDRDRHLHRIRFQLADAARDR